MHRLAADDAFLVINGKINAANTYGEFLRSFNKLQCKELQGILVDANLKMRQALFPGAEEFILDIDSTDHEQEGEKMQGLAFNHKGHWGLDSLQAYDQFGFQYWMDVRPGATYTANGSSELIHHVFKKIPKKLARFIRADSGYCNVGFFNAANAADTKFVTAMKANMFEPLIKRVKNWKLSKKLKFHDGRQVDLGRTLYMPIGSHKALHVAFMRALKPGEENTRALFDDARYDYHAFVTNLGEHEMTSEELILFYRGRGNAENFIKELKYGFDLKHFPCKSLIANKAYGLIAAFAANLMRCMAFIENKKRPHFSKAIRFRMVNLACQVVKHARSITLRFSKPVLEEVNHWSTTITTLQFGSS
jgi:hypothetical protein